MSDNKSDSTRNGLIPTNEDEENKLLSQNDLKAIEIISSQSGKR